MQRTVLQLQPRLVLTPSSLQTATNLVPHPHPGLAASARSRRCPLAMVHHRAGPALQQLCRQARPRAARSTSRMQAARLMVPTRSPSPVLVHQLLPPLAVTRQRASRHRRLSWRQLEAGCQVQMPRRSLRLQLVVGSAAPRQQRKARLQPPRLSMSLHLSRRL